MSENKRYSNLTTKPRELLKKQMDDFATFVWRGVKSFDTYGAFIINNKNSLKFYNGPSFTNEYSKPKFSSTGSNLTGISFSTQTISFQVGAYWLTEAEYREFINWLNPYEISYLGFDFEDKYDYLVKLSKIGDSTRYVVGRNENNEPCYYTELNLTFEVQGEACARARYGYEFEFDEDTPTKKSLKISSKLLESNGVEKPNPQYIISDLNFPFVLNTSLIPNTDRDTIKIQAQFLEYGWDNEKEQKTQEPIATLSLFNVTFQDLKKVMKWTNNDGSFIETTEPEEIKIQTKIKNTYGLETLETPADENIGRPTLNIRYDSESGLLFLKVAEDTEKILSLVNSINGIKIVNNFNTSKCKLPGRFTKPDIINTKYGEYVIQVTIENAEFPTDNNEAVNISAYARTNLI